MPDTKISALAELTTLASTDEFVLVDKSDTSMAASGTDKKITKDNFKADVLNIVQVVNTQTGAVATGTTIIPRDDTIPQNTEGDEYMTLAVTPSSATNELKIDVVLFGTVAEADRAIIVALFQDTTANALAVGFHHESGAAESGIRGIRFTYYMTTGTASATTFKVRAGQNASGTVTFNGSGGSRLFGGVIASSITITEIKV